MLDSNGTVSSERAPSRSRSYLTFAKGSLVSSTHSWTLNSAKFVPLFMVGSSAYR